MTLHTHPTPAGACRALIADILCLADSLPKAEPVNIALSGGSTPALLFRLWADEFSAATPWTRIRLFWVDERCVPPTHAESNYGMTERELLSRVPIPAANVLRIHGEAEPAAEALRYSRQALDLLPQAGGFPVFHLVLLGVGDDGHTSSIFPGQEALLTAAEPYAVARHPQSGQRRIALTGQPIVRSPRVAFLVTGSSKAAVIEALQASADSGPAAYLAHAAQGEVDIYGDEAALG